MIKPDTIVGFVGGHCKGEYDEQKGWENAPAASSEIKARIKQHVAALLGFLEKDDDSRRFDEVERGLRDLIFSLARILLAYFLARREETSKSDVSQWLRKGCRRRKPERKHLNTFFGRVTYWRTYVRRPGGTGIHPLDLALGLSADGFSLLVTEICARLSTLVSYEQVTALSLYFLGWSPSKTSVEKAVLGLGLHTQAWFEAAPPPKDDGEVLVIQFDSKATPTASSLPSISTSTAGSAETTAPASCWKAAANQPSPPEGSPSTNGRLTDETLLPPFLRFHPRAFRG